MAVFLGWGMDPRPVAHLGTREGEDVVALWDYRSLDLPGDVQARCLRAAQVRVVAWSMGVWAYTQLPEGGLGPVTRAVAVNGTALPVHPSEGVAWGETLGAYAASKAVLTREARSLFYRQMCATPDVLRRFRACEPLRDAEGQGEELAAIWKRSQEAPDRCAFHHALIGRRDSVFPAEAQRRHWAGRATWGMLEASHFPFFQWQYWQDTLDERGADT